MSKDSKTAGETDCRDCHGAGFVSCRLPLGHPDFGKAVPCECSRRRPPDFLLDIPAHFRVATFDAFDLSRNPKMREALQRCKRVADGVEHWAFLVGPSGLGKTHLAFAAVQKFREDRWSTGVGGWAYLWSVPALLVAMRGWQFNEDPLLAERELAILCDPKHLIVLDDIGKEKGTDWAREQLYMICDARYVHHGPTILTSNVPVEEIDAAVRDRFRSALVACEGRSQR